MANRLGAGVAPDLGRERCVMYLGVSASPPLLVRPKPISSGAALNRISSLGRSIGVVEQDTGSVVWELFHRGAEKEALKSRARMIK